MVYTCRCYKCVYIFCKQVIFKIIGCLRDYKVTTKLAWQWWWLRWPFFKFLWHLNCCGPWPQQTMAAYRPGIASLWPLKCCGLWPQLYVAATGRKHKLNMMSQREMVTVVTNCHIKCLAQFRLKKSLYHTFWCIFHS